MSEVGLRSGVPLGFARGRSLFLAGSRDRSPTPCWTVGQRRRGMGWMDPNALSLSRERPFSDLGKPLHRPEPPAGSNGFPSLQHTPASPLGPKGYSATSLRAAAVPDPRDGPSGPDPGEIWSSRLLRDEGVDFATELLTLTHPHRERYSATLLSAPTTESPSAKSKEKEGPHGVAAESIRWRCPCPHSPD